MRRHLIYAISFLIAWGVFAPEANTQSKETVAAPSNIQDNVSFIQKAFLQDVACFIGKLLEQSDKLEEGLLPTLIGNELLRHTAPMTTYFSRQEGQPNFRFVPELMAYDKEGLSVRIPVELYDTRMLVAKRIYCCFSLSPFKGSEEGTVRQIPLGDERSIYVKLDRDIPPDVFRKLINDKRIEKKEVSIFPAPWAKDIRMYFSYHTERKTLFTDFLKQAAYAKEHGFNAFNLGFINDSAYYKSPYKVILSPYALDPALIDWNVSGIQGETLQAKWMFFKAHLPEDFKFFARDREMTAYAQVKARDVLYHYPDKSGYGVFLKDFGEMDNATLIASEEYNLVYNIALMEQYIARMQLINVIQHIRAAGLRIGISNTFFRAINGTDALLCPDIFARDGRDILPSGRNIGKMGEELWGDRQKQQGLGLYNWQTIRNGDFAVFTDPMIFYAKEFGVDIILQEAFDHTYAERNAFYPVICGLCYNLGILFVPDVTDAIDPKEVSAHCCHYGMVPIDSLDNASWKFAPDQTARWKMLCDTIRAETSHQHLWIDTEDPKTNLYEKYRALFPALDPASPQTQKITHTVMSLVYGLMTPSYGITFPAAYSQAGETITKINKLREQHHLLGNLDRIRIVDVSEKSIVFIRFAQDMSKGLLGIINLSDETERNVTKNLHIDHMGIDVKKPFTLTDIYNDEKIEFSQEKQNVFADGNIYYELAPGECNLFEIDIDMPASVIERLKDSMSSFIEHDSDNTHMIRTGTGGYIFESARYAAISTIGLSVTGEFDEARDILIRWAKRIALYRRDSETIRHKSYRDDGTVMMNVNWLGTNDYNTSDAPLWFIEAVAEYIKRSEDTKILDMDIGHGFKLKGLLTGIISRYSLTKEQISRLVLSGRSIHRDEKTGFIWVPSQSTAMDTKYTPRQGYPCEIQGLWYNALIRMATLIDPDNNAGYSAKAADLKKQFNNYFWNEAENYVYDVLSTDDINTGPDSAIKDPAVRSNGVIALYLDIIDNAYVGLALKTVEKRLYIPGAIKSLATPTKHYRAGLDTPAWPYADYYPYYNENLPTDERDKAYHNGCGQPWIYPLYLITASKFGSLQGKEALAMLDRDLNNFLNDPATGGDLMANGGIPFITHGTVLTLEDSEHNTYPYAKPTLCYQSAPGVATALMAFERFLPLKYMRAHVTRRIDHDEMQPKEPAEKKQRTEKQVVFQKDSLGRSKVRLRLDRPPVNELSYDIKEGVVVSRHGQFPKVIEDYFPFLEHVIRNKKDFLENSIMNTNKGFVLASRAQIDYIDIIAVGEGGLKVAFLAVVHLTDNRDIYFSLRATKPTMADEDQNSIICSKYPWERYSKNNVDFLSHFGADETIYTGSFYHRTIIFSQEYVFGRTLAEILQDPNSSRPEKKQAVQNAVQFCLDVWDKFRFAVFDPKAENLVAIGGKIKHWKHIDMDKIFSGPEMQPIMVSSREEYYKILLNYYSDFITEKDGSIPDRKEDIKPDTERPAREQKRALDLIRTVEALPAGEGPKCAILCDTSWIKGYRDERGRITDTSLNQLLISLRKFCERNNIIFRESNGIESLHDDVLSISQEYNKLDLLILGEKNILEDKRFNSIDRAFIAGVDNTNLTAHSYIRIIEMLTLLVQLTKTDVIDNDDLIMRLYPRLGFERINRTTIRLTPLHPEEYDNLKTLYQVQMFA